MRIDEEERSKYDQEVMVVATDGLESVHYVFEWRWKNDLIIRTKWQKAWVYIQEYAQDSADIERNET